MKKNLVVSNNNYNAYCELFNLKKNIKAKMKRKDRHFVIKGILFLISFNACFLLNLFLHTEVLYFIAILLSCLQLYSIVDYSINSYINEIKPLKDFQNNNPLIDVDYNVNDLEKCLVNYKSQSDKKEYMNSYNRFSHYDTDLYDNDMYSSYNINHVRKRMK